MNDCSGICKSRLGALFGFFGVLFLLVMLFFASSLTPNYSFFECTISSLADGNGKFLFSIGFIVAGSFGIPFVIYLDRELIGLNEHIRKFTTGFTIFINMCIALVGIIPDKTYIDVLFTIFHGIVSSFAFGGTTICILLHSILIYQNSKLEKHRKFKKYLSYYGFSITPVLILLVITINPFIEWILMILIIIWVMITAIQCIKK